MRSVVAGLCCFLVLLVWAGSALPGGVTRASFLPPPAGTRVRVDASAPILHHHVSNILKADQDTLWLGSAPQKPRAVLVRSITRLQIWDGRGSRGHHAALGAVTGFFVGLTAGAVPAMVSGGEGTFGAVIVFGSVGTVVGTTAGLLWPTGEWREVALPARVSLVSPGNGQIGLALRMPLF